MAEAEKSPENEAHPYATRGQRFRRWLDRRTGIDSLMEEALGEPIPGGARWAYVFGSALLFLFISQTVTGIFLSLYYVPSADHAHTTVSYIVKEVTGGSFLRSLHAYGSSAVVILLLMHLTQTFFYGSYKGRREVLWISGCVLFGLMLAMAFTGYLLPWDQKAYFATTVGTNMASEVPWVGGMLKRFMRGGNEMGTLTLSRFFVAHVFVIPGALIAFIAVHVYLFRKAGAAGPPSEDPVRPKLPAERFYPKQVLMDAAMALLIMVILGVIAHWHPMELGPRANPADTQYVPRPEWYYLPIFQWLKYFKGPLAFVGIVLIPVVTAAVVLFLPFYDRRLERRPWKRPLAIGIYTAILITLFVFGWLSGYEDQKDPAIAKQVAKQNEETEEFMREPFEPESGASSLSAGAAVVLDPVAVQGKAVYESEACDSCHGANGVGSSNGPKLSGKIAALPAEELAKVLRNPTPAMVEGGMQAMTVSDEEMNALVAYIKSLK